MSRKILRTRVRATKGAAASSQTLLGQAVERGDPCVKLWSQTHSRRRSVEWIRPDEITDIQTHLRQLDNLPETIETRKIQHVGYHDAGCLVCREDRPKQTWDSDFTPTGDVGVYLGTDGLESPWVHKKCASELADALDGVWKYLDKEIIISTLNSAD